MWCRWHPIRRRVWLRPSEGTKVWTVTQIRRHKSAAGRSFCDSEFENVIHVVSIKYEMDTWNDLFLITTAIYMFLETNAQLCETASLRMMLVTDDGGCWKDLKAVAAIRAQNWKQLSGRYWRNILVSIETVLRKTFVAQLPFSYQRPLPSTIAQWHRHILCELNSMQIIHIGITPSTHQYAEIFDVQHFWRLISRRKTENLKLT